MVGLWRTPGLALAKCSSQLTVLAFEPAVETYHLAVRNLRHHGVPRQLKFDPIGGPKQLEKNGPNSPKWNQFSRWKLETLDSQVQVIQHGTTLDDANINQAAELSAQVATTKSSWIWYHGNTQNSSNNGDVPTWISGSKRFFGGVPGQSFRSGGALFSNGTQWPGWKLGGLTASKGSSNKDGNTNQKDILQWFRLV